MNHIAHERQEDMRGVVIGGAYVGWQVVYDGRAQSGKLYADNEQEALTAARAYIDDIKARFCGAPCYLYGDDSLWRIRLWG